MFFRYHLLPWTMRLFVFFLTEPFASACTCTCATHAKSMLCGASELFFFPLLVWPCICTAVVMHSCKCFSAYAHGNYAWPLVFLYVQLSTPWHHRRTAICVLGRSWLVSLDARWDKERSCTLTLVAAPLVMQVWRHDFAQRRCKTHGVLAKPLACQTPGCRGALRPLAPGGALRPPDTVWRMRLQVKIGRSQVHMLFREGCSHT